MRTHHHLHDLVLLREIPKRLGKTLDRFKSTLSDKSITFLQTPDQLESAMLKHWKDRYWNDLDLAMREFIRDVTMLAASYARMDEAKRIEIVFHTEEQRVNHGLRVIFDAKGEDESWRLSPYRKAPLEGIRIYADILLLDGLKIDRPSVEKFVLDLTNTISFEEDAAEKAARNSPDKNREEELEDAFANALVVGAEADDLASDGQFMPGYGAEARARTSRKKIPLAKSKSKILTADGKDAALSPAERARPLTQRLMQKFLSMVSSEFKVIFAAILARMPSSLTQPMITGLTKGANIDFLRRYVTSYQEASGQTPALLPPDSATAAPHEQKSAPSDLMPHLHHHQTARPGLYQRLVSRLQAPVAKPAAVQSTSSTVVIPAKFIHAGEQSGKDSLHPERHNTLPSHLHGISDPENK